jgi:hypothetical protein
LTDQLGGLRPFDRIFDTVISGEAGLKLACDDKWTEFLANHPTATVEFQAAMSERTAAFAPSVAATYDFSQMRRVVDVGGGRGTLLAAVLAARTHLDGVVFDLPEVVAGAAETLRVAGVADRCAIESGDFFVAVPSGGHGYLLANVLHDWDDERSAVILRNCRRAMHADGKVLIVERMIFDDPEKSIPTLLSDLNMLVLTGGQERTEEEYARLLVSAGLRLTRFRSRTLMASSRVRGIDASYRSSKRGCALLPGLRRRGHSLLSLLLRTDRGRSALAKLENRPAANRRSSFLQ